MYKKPVFKHEWVSTGTEKHKAQRHQAPKHFSSNLWALTDLWHAADRTHTNTYTHTNNRYIGRINTKMP